MLLRRRRDDAPGPAGGRSSGNDASTMAHGYDTQFALESGGGEIDAALPCGRLGGACGVKWRSGAPIHRIQMMVSMHGVTLCTGARAARMFCNKTLVAKMSAGAAVMRDMSKHGRYDLTLGPLTHRHSFGQGPTRSQGEDLVGHAASLPQGGHIGSTVLALRGLNPQRDLTPRLKHRAPWCRRCKALGSSATAERCLIALRALSEPRGSHQEAAPRPAPR